MADMKVDKAFHLMDCSSEAAEMVEAKREPGHPS
jgi:hypothetical protein